MGQKKKLAKAADENAQRERKVRVEVIVCCFGNKGQAQKAVEDIHGELLVRGYRVDNFQVKHQ